MASLKLNGVSKVFPSGTRALYDVNFETKDKEFIVILGGEASGKSTLLRLIAGLEDAEPEQIFIDGKDMSDVEIKDRDVALVFRDGAIKPTLNVYENLAYGLKLRKAPGALIEQRVKAVANVLGLNDVLYRMPKTLTAAQKQRVAIGRAVIREPKLYLFDEPLAGLDGKLKGELLNVIINLQARMEGTFVYATKSAAEAMTIGTRIAVIKSGIIQQIDTPANLYDYPANAYVAFLIGSPTINFIHKANIIKTEEGVFAAAGQLKLALSENVIKRFENIEEYANSSKTVMLGIRPEDAEISNEGFECKAGGTDNGFTQCDVCGQSLTVTAGKGNKVKIDLSKLYIFDGETRLTLLARDDGYVKTEYADADYTPPTFSEEEELTAKHKSAKTQKKK